MGKRNRPSHTFDGTKKFIVVDARLKTDFVDIGCSFEIGIMIDALAQQTSYTNILRINPQPNIGGPNI